MDELLKATVDLTASSRYPEMSPVGKKELCALLTRKEMNKGEHLLEEGQVCKDIMIVGKGMVRQYYYKNKKDVTEHFSYEGCVVMCLESMLKQEPTKLIVEALENGVVYLLPYRLLLQATEASWELNMFYRKVLEYSLIVSQMKADSWRFETARERYEQLLHNQPEVVKRAPLQHIASYLLMTPETLSRVRANIVQ